MISRTPISDILQLSQNIEYVGRMDVFISKVIALDENNKFDEALMWSSQKNISKVSNIKNGIIICPKFSKELFDNNCNYLFTDEPRKFFAQVLKKIYVTEQLFEISENSVVDSNCQIGEHVNIGNNVIIEKDVIIGNYCCIDSNTVIKAGTKIGNNVTIGANCTIGGVGFGYEKNNDGVYSLIPHIGNVIIEDNVEIGNNTTIDRGVLGSTILREHVKIDNLVHIAHGVEIGKYSLIMAHAMIAGSVCIGKSAWIAPSVSILNKIQIGDNVIIGINSLVNTNVPHDSTFFGNPAMDIKKYVEIERERRKIIMNKVK